MGHRNLRCPIIDSGLMGFKSTFMPVFVLLNVISV